MSSASHVFNTTTHAAAQIMNINGNVYMMSDDKEERVYRWLDAPDSSGNFLAAREKHHGNTGAWFIEGEEYMKWKDTPDSALWVYGTPGCGKTVICSTVIEETLLRCSENPTYACAYFFFDNRNAQTDQALHDKLIRSIIQQLCDQAGGVPAPLVEIYGSGHSQASVASLQSTLRKIIDGFERTYIIIDALDECTNREKVLAWTEELLEWKSGKIHVLFSSRPEQDIADALRCLAYIARVTLNNKLADKDIETYLDAMLSKMIKCNAQTIERIRGVLIQRADGMFRWVALQIEELSKCRTRRAVEDQLQTLPKDLNGMYERALLKSHNPKELKQLLVWLAFSIRPLELEELADVVTVEFSSAGLPTYNPDLQYFSPSDMLDTYSSFMTEIEGEKFADDNSQKTIRVIKLAHMSVKDYLVSDRLKAGAASYFGFNTMLAHSAITKTCLAYMFHLGSLRSINESVLESFPLGNYASEYWIDHMRVGGGEEEHVSQIMYCIFTLGESALANWVRLDDPDLPEWTITRTNYGKPSAAIAAPLYYACIHDLELVAQLLLIGGAAVDAQGGHYGNALQAASLSGHDAVVSLLLVKGADVDKQGGLYGHALQAASLGGHGAIIRLLLEHGGDVNAQGGHCGTALQAASGMGHDVIVRVLLEQGVNVNAQGGVCGNALQAASLEGRYDVVQLLLEKGAHVNAQGGEYGNALHAASRRGHSDIVRLLLEHGAVGGRARRRAR